MLRLALTSLLLASTAVAADEFEALRVLPDHPDLGIRVEGGIVFKDLRDILANEQRARASAMRSPIGAAYHARSARPEWLRELADVIAWAAPSGAPVPAAMVAFSDSGTSDLGMQVLIRTEPGLLSRIPSAIPSPPGTDEPLAIRLFGQDLFATLHDDWLRIAPEHSMLIPAGPAPAYFGVTMEQHVRRHAGVAFVRGGGMLAKMLGELPLQPQLAEILTSTRAIAVGWHTDAARTSTGSLLIDAPQLRRLAPLVRRPDLDALLTRVWGKDAMSVLTAALPPALVGGLVAAAQSMVDMGALPVDPQLITLLTRWDGGIGWAGFAAPGDWALALSFVDAAAAATATPALLAGMRALDARFQTDFNRTAALESSAGRSVLHLRPEPGLSGLRVTPAGRLVFLTGQRTRLERILAASDEQPLGDTLTAPVAQALADPAMATGYSVLGTDSALFDTLAWAAGLARPFLAKLTPQLNGYLPQLRQYLDDLPTLMALGGFGASLTYDVAVTLDLEDDVLKVDFLSSEL